jgi:bifunctional non-homologous end joining protein LigD
MIRMPDGIHGEQKFFQRHTGKGQSSLITEVEVWGDRKPYTQFDSVEAWWRPPRSARFELHPWNSEPFKPEQPVAWSSISIPRPTWTFADVIKAAHDVRARLEPWGFVSFCKTTGGKGLHVVTPLSAKGIDWAESARLRSRRLPGDGARAPGSLPDQHGEEGARQVGSS